MRKSRFSPTQIVSILKEYENGKTVEEVERKMLRATRAKKKVKDSIFDPYRFLGKLKGVFGDGLDFQKRVRDEW